MRGRRRRLILQPRVRVLSLRLKNLTVNRLDEFERGSREIIPRCLSPGLENRNALVLLLLS